MLNVFYVLRISLWILLFCWILFWCSFNFYFFFFSIWLILSCFLTRWTMIRFLFGVWFFVSCCCAMALSRWYCSSSCNKILLCERRRQKWIFALFFFSSYLFIGRISMCACFSIKMNGDAKKDWSLLYEASAPC